MKFLGLISVAAIVACSSPQSKKEKVLYSFPSTIQDAVMAEYRNTNFAISTVTRLKA